ncbi:uncharacterized protein TRUGW13939_06599 [Talaromyces rugulosus]|uniref:Uncharacterized protein n=1 Tax=Talaromyces rugulosus TaxID=121627 RepID=A0A7H8R130_TALRU|nr:uncharacterized protein TRUGW13939_06599 [Talaromyces rugulosus]QKX59465.1 hypothetical protein TRUGW13939_06599 [Talaromyces rugulosus]
MADDHIQSLRRLAKRYHIRPRLPSDEWPEAHVKTFRNIKALGEYKFDTYSHSISVLSDKEPWKQQTQARARWLTTRAERLFGQDRNEAGWRFGLENDVLRRFTVEVACPRCRARVWQSEIQATWNNENEDYAQQLEERRRMRRPCQCPPNERPMDSYDIGMNTLFDDRAQEFVIHEDLIKSQLPKQGPDRVFGLQNTRSFDKLLSSPVRPDLANTPGDTIADILKTTPFKTQADPLLFPFLVLEAKSEGSASGFDAILVQSSFPIRALLKMQDNLRSNVSGVEGAFSPLVWFLASRGDAWRVYCGHITKGNNEEPAKYDITLLWSGSLLHKDNALQLVLIVDYIMDWAREVYRDSILRQLKSLVTGQSFDQVSLVDSDIFSMRRDISNWIPAPPSTVFDGLTLSTSVVNREDSPPSSSVEEQTMLDIRIPNTKLGSVQSASSANFRFVCLYLTETLIQNFLQVVGGSQNIESKTKKAAQDIVNFITQFEDVLVMSKTDLDLFETLWTGAAAPIGPAKNADEFYVFMEASWYFSSSWEITREVSCLAVNKSAFKILATCANFGVRHKGVENLPKYERHCSSDDIRELIGCIRSGSPWQVLLATISCTLVTIYPLPLRWKEDFPLRVSILGLGYTHFGRVKPFIMKYLKSEPWEPRKNTIVPGREINRLLKQGHKINEIFDMKREQPPKHTDKPWKRISETLFTLKDEPHDRSRCDRCKGSPRSNISPFAHGFLDTRNQPVLSDYNAILVVSLQLTSRGVYTPDSCVFALSGVHELDDNIGLSVMIGSLIQGNLIYHTLKYDVNYSTSHFDMYNLPLPYRSVTGEEELRLLNWIRELQDEDFQVHKEDELRDESSEWNFTRALMYLLRIGHTEKEAALFMTKESAYQYDDVLSKMPKENRGESEKFESFQQVDLRGEQLAQRYSSWIEGKVFLKREYPNQFNYISSLQNLHYITV